MKTFKQFITEGKNKKKLKNAEKQLRKEQEKKIRNLKKQDLTPLLTRVRQHIDSQKAENQNVTVYPDSEPYSRERYAHILDMERRKKEWLKSLRNQDNQNPSD